MKRAVVDASVAVKWFVPEIHSDGAERLLDPDIQLSAPDLIHAEVGNTIWKKVRRAELTLEEGVQIVRAFESFGLDIHPSAVLLESAFELAAALDRTVSDSLYLALAIALRCPLVTADRKFEAMVLSGPFANHIRWVDDPL